MTKSGQFSKRTDWELRPNQLISRLKDIQKTNEPVLDLTESNPTRCAFTYPPKEILEGLAQERNLSYDPSPQGRLEAREAICDYYHKKGYHIDADQVFLTSSTSEAYSFLFRLLTDPGDHMLFPKPSYPLFEFLVDLNDIIMDTYPLAYGSSHNQGEPHWHIDFDELHKTIGPKTRSMVLVNPNNPTGSFVKKEELARINEICQNHHLSLICDEVFLDYQFDQTKTSMISLVDNKHVLSFVLGGISKCLGLPQMKLSWMIVNGPDHLVQAAKERLEVIADTYLSVNTPSQNHLKQWLEYQPVIKDQILNRIKENRHFMMDRLKKCPQCTLLNASGGWYGIIKLPSSLNEEQWVMEFLNKDHVFLHPGYFFDFTDGAHVIVSLLTQQHVFQDGLKRIIDRVQATS